MEKLMNEENEWDHRISAGVNEGPADCIRIDEVVAALTNTHTQPFYCSSGICLGPTW